MIGDANTDTILMTAAPSIGGAGLGMGMGFRNRIINGAMVIDQRNAGASVSPPAAAQTFTLDRWAFYNSTATNRFSVQQTPSTTETGFAVRVAAGFTNYLATTVTSAYTPSGSDQQIIHQAIEGFNIADFAWGTANAQTVTLSFWVRSSLTGTHSGALRNANGFTRSYPFTFTINTANTWEQKSITVAGDTGGTYNSNSSGGIQVAFNLGSGSSSLGTANVWNTTNAYTGATGSVQVSATNGATFFITGVQLEKGSTATSFDYRPYGTEFQLCQRYFEKSYLDGTAVGTFSASDTNSVRFDPPVTSQGIMVGINFAVRKRTAPTMTAYDAAFNAGKTSYFISSWNNNGTTGGWSTYQSGGTIAIAGITGAFAFSFAWIASSEL